MPRDTPALIPPHFRPIERLGRGRTGTVYLVEEKESGRLRALKLLSRNYSARDFSLLREEFLTLRNLLYPHLGQVHDFVAAGEGVPYLLREFIPGTPLVGGPPPQDSDPHEFLCPILDALATLSFLHHNGLSHLDLHAGNVIERTDGRGVLIDVGFFPPRKPKRSRRGSARVQSGAGARSRPRGEASDLYGAGLLLLYRLTGQTKMIAPFAPLAQWDDRLALHLERIVNRALATGAVATFETARDFIDALCDVLGLAADSVLVSGESHVFCGQRKALKATDRFLDTLARRGHASLWVRGSPGSGKSRYLAEVRSRAEIRGFRGAAFRCFPQAPFSVRAFAQLLLGKGDLPAGTVGDAGNPEVLARRLLAGHGLQGDQPLLVTVDDFQHADRLGASIVRAMLRELAEGHDGKLGLLVASTDAPPRGTVGAVSLGPLSRTDAGRLFNQLAFPLAIDRSQQREILGLTKGSPALLHRAARALKRTQKGGRLDAGALFREDLEHGDATCTTLLKFLSLFARPVTLGELAKATSMPPRTIKPKLGELATLVMTERKGSKGKTTYFLASDSLRKEIVESLGASEMKRMHLACAQGVAARSSSKRDAGLLADLVRHYALGGKPEKAKNYLEEAVAALLADGNAGTACRLVDLLFRQERVKRRRLDLALRLSDLARQSGQNELAREALTQVLSSCPPRAKLSVMHRLGVHASRLGDEKEAHGYFQRVLREAEPQRDLERLVDVDAERADLFISQGEFEQAETASRSGLERLEVLKDRSEEAARESEVTLRAISGRLHLRRLELPQAVRQFQHALRLAKLLKDEEPQASILNNLAVAYNQLNQFHRAKRTFAAAERVSRRLGRCEVLVHITGNLAVIAAKTGDAEEAQEYLKRAAAYAAEVPGERVRLSVAQAETVVNLTLGHAAKAVKNAEEAIRFGKRSGDLPHVRFLELYRAEALLDSDMYDGAEGILRRLVRECSAVPALVRMARARLCYLHSQLGRLQAAKRLVKALCLEAGQPVAYLETWNDFFIGCAQENCGEDGRTILAAARERFLKLSVPFGAARCGTALVAAGVRRRDEGALRPILHQLEALSVSSHVRLAIEVPLVCGEACLFLGEAERARQHLHRASSAIVGRMLPELDLRLEAAWAKLAAVSGDVTRARRYVHRALIVRTHLAERLSKGDREKFFNHQRWRDLAEMEEHLFRRKPLPAPPKREETFGIVARSAAMQEVVRQIRQIGARDISVLIRGPTGCGKDLVAQAIHDASGRHDGPFVVVHVPTIQVQLFESELFGYVKGSFTGADRDRTGLLHNASRGTLYFDEISAMDPDVQVKLLRVLDRRTVRPLGGTEDSQLDVRFLFSTSKDLRHVVAQDRFRDDLYWRIAQAEITVPPLRSRGEDLPELIAVLFRKHARVGRAPPALDPQAVSLLRRLPWPGNVRQLETVLHRAVLACGHDETLTVEILQQVLSSPLHAGRFSEEVLEDDDLESVRRELEIAWLKKRFVAAGGNASVLAERVGLTRPSLYAWFNRLGVNPDLWREEVVRRRPTRRSRGEAPPNG